MILACIQWHYWQYQPTAKLPNACFSWAHRVLVQMGVISGVGVRKYYERFGYKMFKDYQVRLMPFVSHAYRTVRHPCESPLHLQCWFKRSVLLNMGFLGVSFSRHCVRPVSDLRG